MWKFNSINNIVIVKTENSNKSEVNMNGLLRINDNGRRDGGGDARACLGYAQ